MKIASATLAAIIAIPILIGGIGQAIVKTLFGSGNTQPSQEALADIPGDYLALYQAAAPLCPGLDWSILAAIGKIESDHGRSPLPGVRSGHNSVHGPAEGAMGPMQFMPKTWRDVRAQHPEIGPDVYGPENAIPGAAHYLCDSGAQKDIRKAIFAYNNADWYVNDVLAQAKKYGDAMVGTGNCTTIQAPNPAAAMAINYACGQLGLPYIWGQSTDPMAVTLDSTAPDSPKPPTVPPGSPCPEPRTRSTTPVHSSQPESPCFPVTCSSTAHRTKSIMWACTSARGRWCTRRPSVSRSRSARIAGAVMTTSRRAAQLSTHAVGSPA